MRFIWASATLLAIALPPRTALHAGQPAMDPSGCVIVDDGGAGKFASWPDLLRMPDGTLICCFYQGYAHGSPPTDTFPNCGKMACRFSQDNGKTWSTPVTMVDTDGDDHDGHLVLLKDGRLLCNYFCEQYYTDENGKRVRIKDRDALVTQSRVCLIESADKGRTWGPPRVVPTCWKHVQATAGSVIELPNGHLIMPVYGWERAGKAAGVGVVRSEDGGKTWGPTTLLVKGLDHGQANEMGLVQMRNGTLLALIRSQMLQCLSSDGGKTWTQAVPIGIAGHAPCVIEPRSGVLVCGIRMVGSAHGTGVIVSRDQGKTWRGPYRVDTVGGAYPGLVELADGSIYIVYYEEGAGSKIRGKRFRLTEDGIAPLLPTEWK